MRDIRYKFQQIIKEGWLENHEAYWRIMAHAVQNYELILLNKYYTRSNVVGGQETVTVGK